MKIKNNKNIKLKNKKLKKDYMNRYFFNKNETWHISKISILKNMILPLYIRQYIENNYSNLHNLSYTFNSYQIRNKCILTGRNRGIISKYGISRLMFRKLVDNGYISGYKYK